MYHRLMGDNKEIKDSAFFSGILNIAGGEKLQNI